MDAGIQSTEKAEPQPGKRGAGVGSMGRASGRALLPLPISKSGSQGT